MHGALSITINPAFVMREGMMSWSMWAGRISKKWQEEVHHRRLYK